MFSLFSSQIPKLYERQNSEKRLDYIKELNKNGFTLTQNLKALSKQSFLLFEKINKPKFYDISK